ncbi:MAG: AgmX/PglI C-terminal domain-containing protein [Deltaproteobacteria bacterium]|nr:AgmX/PglI C-terminal domain-containing protein [Deltaproteobacteria bacterium]
MLIPCPSCRRHVRIAERACPFCAAAALLVTGCAHTPAPTQDSVPPVSSTVVVASTAPSSSPSDVRLADAAAPEPTPSAIASAAPPTTASPEPSGPAPAPTVASNPPKDPHKVAVYGPPPGPRTAPVYGPPPGLDEARSPADTASVFAAAKPHFRKCWVQSSPTQSGTATVQLTIAPDGKVSKAAIVDSTLPPEVQGCLLARAKMLRFSPAKTETAVRFPLRFSP